MRRRCPAESERTGRSANAVGADALAARRATSAGAERRRRPTAKREVLAAGQVALQRRVVAEVGEFGVERRRRSAAVSTPRHSSRPSSRSHQAAEGAQQGRLAGAVDARDLQALARPPRRNDRPRKHVPVAAKDVEVPCRQASSCKSVVYKRIADRSLRESGAPGRTRTGTSFGKQILSPLRLPIPPPGHGLIWGDATVGSGSCTNPAAARPVLAFRDVPRDLASHAGHAGLRHRRHGVLQSSSCGVAPSRQSRGYGSRCRIGRAPDEAPAEGVEARVGIEPAYTALQAAA